MSYYPHTQHASFYDEYVSPQNLSMLNTGFPSSSTIPQPQVQLQNYRPGAKLEEVGCLEPGKQHQLSQDPIPTPQSILDGSYTAAMGNVGERDIVVYVPRSPDYSGKPSLPSVVFSVNGKPGPYLGDLIKGRVTVDSPFEELFRQWGWHRTSLTIDWPGVATTAEYISCSETSKFRTRSEVAVTVAARVADLLRAGKHGQSLKWGHQTINARTEAWDMTQISYRDVRLIGINYYRKTWVAVLAMDS